MHVYFVYKSAPDSNLNQLYLFLYSYVRLDLVSIPTRVVIYVRSCKYYVH